MRERIKEIIEREGMSQSQFADYIGVNRPTLSHILARSEERRVGKECYS